MQSGFFSEEEMGKSSNYQVLARKYRPRTFKDMIGQEALVRILTNAFKSDRIAHAFVLTGIRGVGKTTTARIIARALNCIGTDGKGLATVEPCGLCTHCVGIAEDRHQDVYEFDAASHTGVNDIREIIENTRYKPIAARYKVYIIDEVHMLSNSAFNALLKTLEEPPLHVKFIFATTEIRKIPATILSRCQRFDLRRIAVSELCQHLKSILDKEGFSAEEDALKLIAKIAGGSVRDGLSIMDQALSHSESKLITTAQIREMLGLAGSEKLYSLFDNLVKGNVESMLNTSADLYRCGSEPLMILQDMLELTHNIMLRKHSSSPNLNLTEEENSICSRYAEKLDVPALSRIWQMLQKGVEEVRFSQMPYETLDIVLIRMAYASTLPSVEDIIKKLKSPSNTNTPSSTGNYPNDDNVTQGPTTTNTSSLQNAVSTPAITIASLSSFEQIVQLCYDADEMMLYHLLRSSVQFVSLNQNTLALKLTQDTPKDFLQMLQTFLRKATNEPWKVISSYSEGTITIHEQEKLKESTYIETLKSHESVQTMLKTFTGIEIIDIKNKQIA